MTHPKIIQGGMGVAISAWQLAQAVSKTGQLGVVSGTGIGIILIARLMDGDTDGKMREALAHFPDQVIAQGIIDKYYIEGGKDPELSYKRPPMWTANPPESLEIITVVANFVEVWLAKQGHDNPVGLNLLEKVQMPTMSSLYGAMLAGVDYVIMGAGIPIQIPGILDKPAYLREYHTGDKPYETQFRNSREVIFHGPFYSETGNAVVVIRAMDNKDRWIMKLDLPSGKLKLLDRQHDV